MIENDGLRHNCDFDQMLFFKRQKHKKDTTAYRRALDQWIKDGRFN